MKLLLDTNAFIWWNSNTSELSRNAFDAIENEENELIISMISFWEIQIKLQISKLELDMPLTDMIKKQKADNNVKIISLEFEHILAMGKLPMYHKDIFDRVLIAQAMVENATLITKDHKITTGYGSYIKTFW
jgi:PIN domain nuclease of toxin-antitoxin system